MIKQSTHDSKQLLSHATRVTMFSVIVFYLIIGFVYGLPMTVSGGWKGRSIVGKDHQSIGSPLGSTTFLAKRPQVKASLVDRETEKRSLFDGLLKLSVPWKPFSTTRSERIPESIEMTKPHSIPRNRSPFKAIFKSCLTDGLCFRTRKALDAVGLRLSKILRFRQEIRVFVEFSRDMDPDNIAGAGSTMVIRGRFKGEGEDLSYPISLAKQFNAALPVFPSLEADIYLVINSEIPFVSAGDTLAKEIGGYDLELVLMHELLHGLGFHGYLSPQDGVVVPSKTPRISNSSDFDLKWQGKGEEEEEEMFLPPNVFESRLIDAKGRRVLQLMNKMRHSESQSTNLLVGSTVFFQTKTGQLVPMDASLGTSPYSHIDQSLEKTVEFLMVPSCVEFKGKSISQLQANNNKKGTKKLINSFPLGPLTLEILRSIGWETHEDPWDTREFMVAQQDAVIWSPLSLMATTRLD